MTLSENGWPAYENTAKFVRTQCEGVWWWSANSDVAFVMDRLTTWFATTVEPLVMPYNVGGQWSWAPRDVRGSTTTISNHESATARDLNAADHPRGVRGTFTDTQTGQIHGYLRKTVAPNGRRIFRWGGDYVISPVDSMHFEIDCSAVDLASYVRAVKIQEAVVALASIGDIWNGKVPLTAYDADMINLTAGSGPLAKAGDMVAFGDMVRYPILVRRVENEVGKLSAQVTALAALVQSLIPPKG